ncbi:RDD family protein [Novosphingobium mangrovi (ex Huang et al. 2023)]|uniref:RDD family protein n=1 Tax=Novosphingobium mangrovi (ex Huang et al. 2023) TaxID=2976432 RepID=A0ABT2I2K2_9SPHN|nr:RDD family protein [Novosphingobium mangrovi (ex Huang et al. 2023)]MCT2399035.1 RDD family protein [Novosphingobium mangrovi (ex Huang et al. 2023)]
MSVAPARLRASGRDRVLVTPEGIALTVTVASRGARAGALFLDLIFIVLLMVGSTIALLAIAGGAAQVLDEAKSGSAAGHALQFLLIVWIVIMFLFRNAYFLFFELGPRGATPGKRLTGIRIAARDGGRLTADMVIARNLLRDIELFLPLVFFLSAGADSGWAWMAATAWLLLFLLFPLFNRDVLRAGDVIAGSWVLERPRQKLEAAMTDLRDKDADAQASRHRYQFDDEQLAVYGEFELQALERVLREDRQQSIDTVYQTIAEKIGRNDGWNDEKAFLEDYYAQLRARLEGGMRMGRRKADKFSE